MYDDLIKRLIWTASNDEKPFDAETALLAAKAIEKLILERDAAIHDLAHLADNSGDACSYCAHLPCAEKHGRCIGFQYRGFQGADHE